jgi:hypothetical protein
MCVRVRGHKGARQNTSVCVCVCARACRAWCTRLHRAARTSRAPPLPTCRLGPSPPPHPTGTIGGTYATPLVSPPEVAIVALGRLQLLPRYPAVAAEAAVAAAAAGVGAGGSSVAAGPLVPVPVSVMPVSR